MTTPYAAHEKASQLAVESYGRLLAFLASRCGDVSLAEDALAQAFLAALQTWPERGVPERPEGWLLAVARNSLRDGARRQMVRDSVAAVLQLAVEAVGPREQDAGFPDERLKLLFVCAHPAIEASARTPLMLQVVLGLDAARIGEAFLVLPAAMGQRLSRAKAKIAAAGIPFVVPEKKELPERLHAVLEAVYGAFGLGWSDLTPQHNDLTGEALWLARLLVSLLPAQAEAHGLLALLLHAEARRPARRDAQGAFVPLSDQDVRRWTAEMQAEAERHLVRASELGELGPFQLEAAIQSAHASRARTGRTPWPEIAGLYDALVRLRPSLGTWVSRAATHGMAFGPQQGLALLQETAAFKGRFDYQPYWACRAHLERAAGREAEARSAYRRAIDLAGDLAVRQYLQRQLERAGDGDNA